MENYDKSPDFNVLVHAVAALFHSSCPSETCSLHAIFRISFQVPQK